MKRLKKIGKWWADVIERNYLAGLLTIALVGGTMFLMLMPTSINRFLVEDAGPTIVGWLAKAITFVFEDVIWAHGRNLLGWDDPAVARTIKNDTVWQWMPYAVVVCEIIALLIVVFVLNLIGWVARWLYLHRPVVMWRSAYQGLLDACDSQYKTWRTTYDHGQEQDVKHRLEVGQLQDKLVALEQRLYDTRTSGGRRAVQAVREDLTDWLLEQGWLGGHARVHLEARRRKPTETASAA